MMPSLRQVLCLALLGLLVSPAAAQRRHDPLNPAEIDQLRDTALESEERLKLLVQFARARLLSLDQMRADPKAKDRARQTHDFLQDFLDIYDELDDNVDMYVERKEDVRKPLKMVITADIEFQAKLRALKDAAPSPQDDPSQYQFVLSSAVQAVDDAVEDHRQLLVQQEEAAKHKKKPKS
jgi:hypothetical protein